MRFSWEGLVDYQDGLASQRNFHQQVLDGADDIVLGLEHNTVITLGVRGKSEFDVFGQEIPIVQTDRGGQATLHSPGQLVIYPIFNLQRAGLGARDFVQSLLVTTADVLCDHNIEAYVDKCSTGVFTPKGKIAFCGLRIENFVTRHGLSLNIANDLGLFQNIRPCGVSTQPLTTWSADFPPPSLQMIFRDWETKFLSRVGSQSQRVMSCESSPHHAV